MANRKLFTPMFTPNMPNGTIKIPGSKPMTGPQLAGQLRKIDQSISRLNPTYKADAANAAKAYLQGKYSSMNNSRINNSGSKQPSLGVGSIVFSGSKRIAENNTSYALSKAPNPKDIHLNSGIRPNTFVNDSMVPVEGSCASLHGSLGILAIPTGSTNPLATYWTNNIVFDIQTRAQANISFGLDVVSAFSATNITSAVNAAIYALQIYFFYSSILSYESDTRNKNAGMVALRNAIDAQTLSDLTQLGRRLEDTPMPPRLVEWVRYMNGNFLSSNSQGASILKFFPTYSSFTSTPIVGSLAAGALAGLITDSNNTVFTLLRRAIPQWRIGVLRDCPPLPTYSKNFVSIFANASGTARISAVNTFFGSVTDLNTALPYNAYNNNLDGLAFAMSNVYNSTTSEWVPGLCRAFTASATNLDSRQSYYSVSGVKGFYPVVSYPFLAMSRQETTCVVGTTVYTPHLFGTEKCQNVTGSALVQAGQNALDFLFDVNKIPSLGTLSSFSKKANGGI